MISQRIPFAKNANAEHVGLAEAPAEGPASSSIARVCSLVVEDGIAFHERAPTVSGHIRFKHVCSAG